MENEVYVTITPQNLKVRQRKEVALGAPAHKRTVMRHRRGMCQWKLSTTDRMLNTSAETAVAIRNATGTDFRFMSKNIIGTRWRALSKDTDACGSLSCGEALPIMGKWFLSLAICGCFMLIILLAAL